MNERFPSVPFTRFGVRAVHVIVEPSELMVSHTRVVPTIMWLQRAPHSALPTPPGLPLNRSNGSTKDCVSLRIVVARMSPVNTFPEFEQFALQRWIAPLLLLA